MITIQAIKARVKPIGDKYDVAAIYLFGSYARGDAVEASDIDFCVDYTGSSVVKSLFDFGGVFVDLMRAFDIYFDLITEGSLITEGNSRLYPEFYGEYIRERKRVYERPKRQEINCYTGVLLSD